MNVVVIAWLGIAPAVLAAGVPPGRALPFQAQSSTNAVTAQISGTVIAAATGGPIRGATVSLSDEDEHDFVAQTDDEGRFEFDRLPPGRYHLAATRPGFLDVEHGQKRPGSGAPGVAIHVANGQRVDRIVLAMPRGGALSGIVLDPFGDPAFGARVTALRYAWEKGERILVAGETVLSDERGLYRVAVLPPGEYVVKASPPDTASEERAEWVEIYHPGVASLGAASVVLLGLSEERSGIDVALQRIPTRRIAGVVVDADGRPPLRPLMIALADAESGAMVGGTSTQLYDGKFSFPSLGPGRYTITVIAGAGVQAWTTAEALPAMDDASTDGPVLWARAEVFVGERDVSDLRLMLQPGMTVSGRVAISDGTRFDLTTVRVRITPAASTSIWRPIPATAIDARGDFAIAGVPPGRYRFSIEGAGESVTLSRALVGDRDALDFPFEVAPHADIAGAVLTLTDRPTELAGTLSDATGQPTSDYMVVVFAADARYWVFASRRIVAARPASDGHYAFRGLPAGEYRMAALNDVGDGQWFDPRFLRELAAASIPVRLSDGEQRTQDVRIK